MNCHWCNAWQPQDCKHKFLDRYFCSRRCIWDWRQVRLGCSPYNPPENMKELDAEMYQVLG